MVVEVFEFRPDSSIVAITTSDKLSMEKYFFLDIGDGKYGKDIKLTELEKLWEERALSPDKRRLPN